MLKYKEVKKLVFASGSVSDGYFGKRKNVGFAYDPDSKKTLVVSDIGYHNSGIPNAIDKRESLWLLSNHPIAKGIRIQK